jgi:hypothetical protein
MKMIEFKSRGNFSNIENFFSRVLSGSYRRGLDYYARQGVKALEFATPKKTGKTASSWNYRIEKGFQQTKIIWENDNIVNGIPIAVILQYGHGTRNGGYVEGRDYINPAIRPIFDQIANSAWEEVTR